MDFYSEIIGLISSKKIRSKEDLHKTKVKLCKKYKIDRIPKDSEILAKLRNDILFKDEESYLKILRKKPMRTISGVAVIAVMTSPEYCPHGKCTPCPGGLDMFTPQSYTGHEPAAMRASLNNYDPFLQTKSRIDQLVAIGHPVDKIDLIIMGGTFTSRDPYYQKLFVKRCFDAFNNSESESFELAKKKNETARSRCIGLTVETRPDWFRLRHVEHVLNLGATRVELGVQTVFDDVLYKIERGHTVQDTIRATQIAKESGFKICYHMMLGLPGNNEKIDLESFKIIFENDSFKPDMIKIYPTLTIKGTKLFEMFKKDEYTPLSNDEAIKLISKIKRIVPKWVRIQRIQRDIPAPLIDAGVDKSNLRQLVESELDEKGEKCRCIRCREIGHKLGKNKIDIDERSIELEINNYQASGGNEVFISLVEKKNDLLMGYLRLRDLILPHRWELSKKPCMIIREVKVLGRELPIGIRSNKGWQHRGFGRALIKEAESICFEEFDKNRLYVLSGVGVKEYYRKNGYIDEGIYLRKDL